MKREREPAVAIHGGAGKRFEDPARWNSVERSLEAVRDMIYEKLTEGVPARDAVVFGCRLLEDDPLFNAGLGSAIQSDGTIRLTASLMTPDCFSGVVNVQNIANPIDIASFLQSQPDRVIAGEGAQNLARELGLPETDLRTNRRVKEWERRGEKRDANPDVASPDDDRHGTIGVVACDVFGNLCAGTSTGGRGFERVGRVSDVASPAGTFCSDLVAVSATGIGEHIVDAALASSIGVGAEWGSLHSSVLRFMERGTVLEHAYGVIAVSHSGEIVIGKTTDIMLASFTGNASGLTLDWGDGLEVERYAT